jgi:hypothetical protein
LFKKGKTPKRKTYEGGEERGEPAMAEGCWVRNEYG